MYGEELSRQLALDYCCSPADVADSENHFSIYAPQEGRRRFQEALIRGLKIAVVNGKLLFTGSEEIVAECSLPYFLHFPRSSAIMAQEASGRDVYERISAHQPL
mgnify:CR=1 FL=1